MSVVVRELTRNDLEAVFELEQKCFKEAWKFSDLEYEFEKNPVNKFIVLEKDRNIIGFIDFMITFNSATISQICVSEKYRKHGFGFRLLQEMEAMLPKEGEDIVENITLEVRESNVPAVSLYQKFGYEVVVKKPHYYPDGEDAVYMVKRLLLCR